MKNLWHFKNMFLIFSMNKTPSWPALSDWAIGLSHTNHKEGLQGIRTARHRGLKAARRFRGLQKGERPSRASSYWGISLAAYIGHTNRSKTRHSRRRSKNLDFSDFGIPQWFSIQMTGCSPQLEIARDLPEAKTILSANFKVTVLGRYLELSERSTCVTVTDVL